VSAGRRAFLRGAALALAAAAVPRPAAGEAVRTLGLVLPAGAAGVEVERGATVGLDDASALATALGMRLRLLVERPAGGAGVAGAVQALAKGEGALAVVGGLGDDEVLALVEAAAAAGVLLVNAGADGDLWRGARCGRHVFHTLRSAAMAADALVGWLDDRRGVKRWTIAADGSARARALEAAARRAIGRRGGAVVPAGSAGAVTFLALDGEPLREALARARAAGAGEAVAGVGDDVVAAGDATGVWAAGWHASLQRFSARELNRRFRRRTGADMTERSWAAWAAVKVLGEAIVRGRPADARALRGVLEGGLPFDGHKGAALTFRPWDHQLRQPLYVLGPRHDPGGAGAPPGIALLGEIAGPDLDAIGTAMGDTPCRFTP
jgi:ABC-type branched-subunit amino acid transport system substrate-binding protein